MKNNQSVQSIVVLAVFTQVLGACGLGEFKDKEYYRGSYISQSGDRVVGLKQKFKGACDTSDRWHPVEWCGGYDNTDFVKDHMFQVWTSTEPSSLTWLSPEVELLGEWSEDLEGEVHDADYVYTDGHHYLIVSAQISDFVETGMPIRSGQFVVYKINLTEQGSINSVEDIVRIPVQLGDDTCVPLRSRASTDGAYIAVIAQGDCVGDVDAVTLYEADSLNVMHTYSLPIASDSSWTDRWRGHWLTVASGAADAEVARVMSEPRFYWSGFGTGPSSMANPLFREAVVDFVAAREEVAQSQETTQLFLLQYGDGALYSYSEAEQTMRPQIRVTTDGVVSAQAFQAGDVPFGLDSYGGRGEALIFDFDKQAYRIRGTYYATYYHSPLSSGVEKPNFTESRELNLGDHGFMLFEDDLSRGLESQLSSDIKFSYNESVGGPLRDGLVVSEFYTPTEELDSRHYVVALACAVQAERTGTDSYGWDEGGQCGSSWAGRADAFQDQAHGQFAWTFNDANELFTCLATTSSEAVARGFVVRSDDLIAGCNGTAWRRVIPRDD